MNDTKHQQALKLAGNLGRLEALHEFLVISHNVFKDKDQMPEHARQALREVIDSLTELKNDLQKESLNEVKA